MHSIYYVEVDGFFFSRLESKRLTFYFFFFEFTSYNRLNNRKIFNFCCEIVNGYKLGLLLLRRGIKQCRERLARFEHAARQIQLHLIVSRWQNSITRTIAPLHFIDLATFDFVFIDTKLICSNQSIHTDS